MAERTKVLQLYRRILTLHRKKLEPHMRILGDNYVRDEFKRHKGAAPKFVQPFLHEWTQYATVMSQKQDRFGEELSKEAKMLLDAEQRDKLRALQEAAKLVGETIT